MCLNMASTSLLKENMYIGDVLLRILSRMPANISGLYKNQLPTLKLLSHKSWKLIHLLHFLLATENH